ncbi:MAG: A/G-specific adenine glycosylase [Alphaproteobacteria bacterium]
MDALPATAAVTLADRLLAWYDRHRRHLPWRSPPGMRPDPYHVWLSEIMLQQTTVVAVAPYFQAFLERWPTVGALAAAPLDDVLHAWQGLGYYARARNLHKCAQVVAAAHGGAFPETEPGLRELPGIGRYTAAAIAAIAFGRRAVVVDGNVERVMARLFRVVEPLPDSKEALYALADRVTPDERPGDYAQAAMDLGATVCTPRKPRCMLCPWSADCAGRDIAETLPAKRAKAAKPLRRGTAFWIVRADGAVLLRRRPESGLLGGMMEVPSTDWLPAPLSEDPTAAAPLRARHWHSLPGVVRHGFTHFDLELTVMAGRSDAAAPLGCLWCLPDRFGGQALPTVMKKVVAHVLRVT